MQSDKNNYTFFEKTLITRWSQRTLQKRYIPIKSVAEINGTSYLQIYSEISGTPDIDFGKNEPPSISEAFDILRDKIPDINLPPPALISTNTDAPYKALMQLFMHLERFTDCSDSDAQTSLKRWVCELLSKPPYEKIKIEDFSNSWRNGLALCALIHSYNPKCIKFDKIGPLEAEANVRLAIYASNVLLNFDDLFSYKDFVSASTRAIVLLLAEYHFAFKNSDNMNFAKESVSKAAKLFSGLHNINEDLYSREKKLDNKIDEMSAKLSKIPEMSGSDAIQKTSKIFKATKNVENMIGSVLEIERLRFDQYLLAMKMNALPIVERISDGAHDFAEKRLTKFEELKRNRCAVENRLLYNNNENHIAVEADKRHSAAANQAINWAKQIRKQISESPRSFDTRSIINEINCHKSLNIEINTKKNYFHVKLKKELDLLEDIAYGKLEQSRDRIDLEAMFEVINRCWLVKLSALRVVESQLKVDSLVKQRLEEYNQLFEGIEERQKKFFDKYGKSNEAINLIEIKRLSYSLSFEKIMCDKMRDSDLKQMDLIEEEINERSIEARKYVFDKSFFESKKKRIDDFKEISQTRFEELQRIISDLVARELYKEKILSMENTHKEMSSSLVEWCDSEKKELSLIESHTEDIEEAQSRKDKVAAIKNLMNYKMDKVFPRIKLLGKRVTGSRYDSSKYPNHCWRYNCGEEKTVSFRERHEKIVLAIASLSNLCDKLEKIIENDIKRLTANDDFRIQYSAVAEQFEFFVSEGTNRSRENLLNNRTSPDSLERTERERSAETESLRLGALALFNHAKKKFSECEEHNAAFDISSEAVDSMRVMYSNFETLLNASQLKFQSDAKKLRQKDMMCKNYAEVVERTLLSWKHAHFAEITTEQLVSAEMVKNRLIEIIRGIDSAEAEVKELENKLIASDVKFNPYTANKYEDVNLWALFFKTNLQHKIDLFDEIMRNERVASLTLFELKNLHKNYSKHFDANKKPYMNIETFRRCMNDLDVQITDKELEEIYDKHGVKSKKNPEIKLLGYKKFVGYMQLKGQKQTRQVMLRSFAVLNNGLPFITREQLAKKLSLTDLNFIETAIKKASNEEGKKLFFSEWIDWAYQFERKENQPVFGGKMATVKSQIERKIDKPNGVKMTEMVAVQWDEDMSDVETEIYEENGKSSLMRGKSVAEKITM